MPVEGNLRAIQMLIASSPSPSVGVCSDPCRIAAKIEASRPMAEAECFLTHPALEPESEGGVLWQHPGQVTRRFAPTAMPSIQDAVPTQNRVRSRSMFNPALS